MQTWNSIISYIKRNLGAPLNIVEISDEEMVQYLKEDVLPVFSQYAPHKKYCAINETTMAPDTGALGAVQPRYTYQIPIEDDEYIVDIHDVYTAQSTILADDYAMTSFNHFGAMDTVIANSYIDAIKSIGVRNTWEFVPPNKIIMDQPISNSIAIVVYAVPHTDLATVPPDLYHLMLKKLCLGQVMLWLASMRSKFENLATPFGNLPINWQELKADGQRLIDETTQQLMALPPDKLIEISV